VKIEIDPDRCMGHGQCEMFGPDLFAVDDDGLAHPRVEQPGTELQAQARDAAQRCPEGAILLHGK
jgi:ferredoxin